LQLAHKTEAAVTSEHPMLKIDGKHRSIRIIVEPLARERGAEGRRWAVAFQEIPVMTAGSGARRAAPAPHPDMLALEQELQTTKIQLQATIDELETSNEEMKSANEEYQSVNEELQSSNEELETAKEEMQSINEELQTINAEMSSKNETLTRLNSDLKNLLDSTQIATLFLDNELHITYFTPAMTELFHLRDSDRGRPITDLVTRINYRELRRDVAKVIRTLAVIENEVSIDPDGTIFLMRMRPYRTVDNVIDGVVITFMDITARKRHEELSAHLAAIVESSQDAIISHDFEGTITSWNAGAEAIFGYTAAEAIDQPFSILIPPDESDDVPQMLDKVKSGERVEHFEIDRVRKDGKQIDVSLTYSPVKDASGKIVAASTIAREFTERKMAENHRNVLIAELDHRIKNTLAVIASLVAQTVKSASSPQDFARIVLGRIQALGRVHDLLHLHQQSHAQLHDVVSCELAAYRPGEDDRIQVTGAARICLTAKAAQTLSMALHELCTNAVKYGALSTAVGQIEIRWHVKNGAHGPSVSLEWVEAGGPTVAPPQRRGFGSELIERIVKHELHANVQRDFPPQGARCAIDFPLLETTGYVLNDNAEAS
ncbi:MAG: PAS domain S-box protein, partial [Pseudomonadota bacterium]|nr:PAS domain S-box protein [Pseudomonadota bacterium]